jgi:hypothetical protein
MVSREIASRQSVKLAESAHRFRTYLAGLGAAVVLLIPVTSLALQAGPATSLPSGGAVLDKQE